MVSIAAGTVVAKNYLSFARVLERSFHAHHPDVPFHVLLADDVAGLFDPAAERFPILPLEDARIPRLPQFRFRYSRTELTVAAKPFLLRHLLDAGFDRAFFIDADILVLDDLTSVLSGGPDFSVMLTPHHLAPLNGPDRADRELSVLRAGTYNAGFVGVSNTPSGRRFLDWWADRLYSHCRFDLAAGMHRDQRWLNLAPGYIDQIAILRDPACNVAYWNLRERRVALEEERLIAAGRPVRFFHFSGFSPDAPQVVSRHVSGLAMADVGPIVALFERYAALLETAGYGETRAWPYAYDRFDNGVTIPDVARQEHAKLGEAAEKFGDPFETAPAGSYFRWLAGADDDVVDSSRRINRLWDAVYRRRLDVQKAFPDHRGKDRDAFLRWAAGSGAGEHGIPVDLLPRKA